MAVYPDRTPLRLAVARPGRPGRYPVVDEREEGRWRVRTRRAARWRRWGASVCRVRSARWSSIRRCIRGLVYRGLRLGNVEEVAAVMGIPVEMLLTWLEIHPELRDARARAQDARHGDPASRWRTRRSGTKDPETRALRGGQPEAADVPREARGLGMREPVRSARIGICARRRSCGVSCDEPHAASVAENQKALNCWRRRRWSTWTWIGVVGSATIRERCCACRWRMGALVLHKQVPHRDPPPSRRPAPPRPSRLTPTPRDPVRFRARARRAGCTCRGALVRRVSLGDGPGRREYSTAGDGRALDVRGHLRRAPAIIESVNASVVDD